jgi:hypothetical protein
MRNDGKIGVDPFCFFFSKLDIYLLLARLITHTNARFFLLHD